MNMHIEPVSKSHPGARVLGLDLSVIDAAAVDQLKHELAAHGVLAFADQTLSPPDYVRLAKMFGEIEPSTREQFWLQSQPEIYVISNIVENGRLVGNPNDGFAWHTDQYYFKRPTAYTFLYALETPPEGGDTQFCGTYGLYDDLDAETRERFSKMSIRASHAKLNAGRLHEGQEEKFPDVLQPLVRTHPVSGRKFLYFSSKLASLPDGMSKEAFDALHADLIARATAPGRVYSHRWKPKDLVIWDNRGLLHTATSYDKQRYRRLCYRLSVIGEQPFQ
jgi:taurine dioxygenase